MKCVIAIFMAVALVYAATPALAYDCDRTCAVVVVRPVERTVIVTGSVLDRAITGTIRIAVNTVHGAKRVGAYLLYSGDIDMHRESWRESRRERWYSR